jgi:hypothetical protein
MALLAMPAMARIGPTVWNMFAVWACDAPSGLMLPVQLAQEGVELFAIPILRCVQVIFLGVLYGHH